MFNRTLLFVFGCYDNQERDGQGTILQRAILLYSVRGSSRL